MQKQTKGDKLITCVFVSIIMFFFCFVVLRFVTRQVFVTRMGMTNAVTDLILFDLKDFNIAGNGAQDDEASIRINWQELYPFSGVTQESILNVTQQSLLDRYKMKVADIETRLEDNTTTFLPWKMKFTELSNGLERLLQWNIANYSEYNGITRVDGQYLAELQEEKDVSEMTASTVDLARFCENKGIHFLYAEQPSKICVYEDKSNSGSLDHSNQNMDAFLAALQEAGVDTYDHRTDIHAENLNHHDLFYCTDHHWKAETGLWAAQHLMNFLSDQYGYQFDSSLLDADNYTYEVYSEWFLGSQGKKVTLNIADPEDITLIYPKYETSLHYQIPEIGLDEYGPFEITYDMEPVSEIDYYNKNPYAAYDHADRALIQFDNQLIEEGPKVLMIHDSFANCELPFLAMGIKSIDAIDLRYFTGSLKSYIDQNAPDLVIVTYNAIEDQINWTAHDDLFDFS